MYTTYDVDGTKLEATGFVLVASDGAGGWTPVSQHITFDDAMFAAADACDAKVYAHEIASAKGEWHVHMCVTHPMVPAGEAGTSLHVQKVHTPI